MTERIREFEKIGAGLLIGFGAQGRSICTKPLPFQKLYIVDQRDFSNLTDQFFNDHKFFSKQDVRFIKFEISPDTMSEFTSMMKTYEIEFVIDCSYNISTLDLLKALPPKVSFINTSVEEWPAEGGVPNLTTLKSRQEQIRKWYHHTKPNNSILLDCGMNPGLISMWAYDCCRMNYMKAKNITKCIVSEVDTQRSKTPRECGEFLSTWSPNGFNEEVHCPVEGYSEGKYFTDKNRTGYQTVSSSLRPTGEPFLGFTVRHAEAITLHKLFPNATCMYIYKCPDEAVSSLFEYQDLRKLKKERIIYSRDILDGVDELGVLLTDGKKCIWYGSYLSNEDIKELYLGQYINSTSYQVTCGLYMGIQYLFELRKKRNLSIGYSRRSCNGIHKFSRRFG